MAFLRPPLIEGLDALFSLRASTTSSYFLKGKYNPLVVKKRYAEKAQMKKTIQPCLTAVTSVSDGLKGLYNEKLKLLEQTYRFNDFGSPTLTESDGHVLGSILDKKNQFYQILAEVQLSRVFYTSMNTKKALFNGTPDFSMPYNVITITCTVFSLYFGSLLNALHRRTEEKERLLKSKEFG
ncbi:hypothetical protein P3S67_007882 [Capsicum chacoense]